MICVQAEGCAPIPKALQEGEGTSKMWPDAHTLAAGLRVPKAYGDFIILDIVRKSGGTAIAVSDDAIMAAVKEMASIEGIFPAPEGGAALAAYQQLLASGFLTANDASFCSTPARATSISTCSRSTGVWKRSRRRRACRHRETLAELLARTEKAAVGLGKELHSKVRRPM